MARQQYAAVSLSEELIDREKSRHVKFLSWKQYFISSLIFTICCLSFGIMTATIVHSRMASSVSSLTILESECPNPPTRREWRSLQNNEKKNYISAVKCLAAIPSTQWPEGSLYDEFVYVHMMIGQYSHFSASFLPWHRLFIHIFEKALVDRCGFKGNLPYWDWTLDWQQLEQSSIWDKETGFGGDGDSNVKSVISPGNCVTNGPFSDLELLLFNQTRTPHCLTRGFMNFETKELGQLSGERFRPEKIGQLMRAPDYDLFRNIIEWTVHNAMHWGIRGDFGQTSAANDPIFWLHHTQLDRLWWIWQQESPERRYTEYTGLSFNSSSELASLNDTLRYSDISNAFQVWQGMRSDTALLCYRY